MKPTLVLFSMLALLSVASGETPVVRSLWNIQVELQIVRIPEETALPLISELRDAKGLEAANAKLQKMIAGKQATLVDWPILTTQNGAKAVMESIDELRYATEFSPPTVGPKSDEPDAGKLNVDATIFEATPVQFEVRNTGITLEVDPAVVEEGKLIQFAVAVQRVKLKGFNKITLEKPGDGRKVVVEQPEFETTKTTTTLRLHNGERILLAVHKTSTLPSELEIYLLRVEAIKVE